MFLGINTANHDASVCLVDTDMTVRFAAHAERYSRIKNDPDINIELIGDMLRYGNPTSVYWFEKPWQRTVRKLITGEPNKFYSASRILNEVGLGHLPVNYIQHHEAHAAQAYYTSGSRYAAVLVIDAIGEWNTVSIWSGKANKLDKVWTQNYPHSMGLFYSAVTQALGYKPNEEEYIVMGMAAYGKPMYVEMLKEMFFVDSTFPKFKLRHNLHRGMKAWLPDNLNPEDLAASAQAIFEEYLVATALWIRKNVNNHTLILGGGSALNCVANNVLRKTGIFDNIIVPANPGDSGLSMGAIAAHFKLPIKCEHAYLVYDIATHIYVREVVHALAAGHVVGVAHGRAEWGPRSLGNRSLLADPRGPYVKARVNSIKHRHQFRPFAPVVLAEHADDYFDIDHTDMNYMQFAVECLKPKDIPAVCHIDGTSRVQTVYKDNPSIIREILEAWKARSGCPILLNTSLNIRGEPLVNSRADADRFAKLHNIAIF